MIVTEDGRLNVGGVREGKKKLGQGLLLGGCKLKMEKKNYVQRGAVEFKTLFVHELFKLANSISISLKNFFDCFGHWLLRYLQINCSNRKTAFKFFY